jgi:hypothetical protein
MTLANWAENGWLQSHSTSEQEITNLLSIVERELSDAAVTEISLDARFRMLYNAALKLTDVALRAAGYRPARGESQHYRTIMSLPLTLGSEWADGAEFLDAIRNLRHKAAYESVGFATHQQLDELQRLVAKLREAVQTRLEH